MGLELTTPRIKSCMLYRLSQPDTPKTGFFFFFLETDTHTHTHRDKHSGGWGVQRERENLHLTTLGSWPEPKSRVQRLTDWATKEPQDWPFLISSTIFTFFTTLISEDNFRASKHHIDHHKFLHFDNEVEVKRNELASHWVAGLDLNQFPCFSHGHACP